MFVGITIFCFHVLDVLLDYFWILLYSCWVFIIVHQEKCNFVVSLIKSEIVFFNERVSEFILISLSHFWNYHCWQRVILLYEKGIFLLDFSYLKLIIHIRIYSIFQEIKSDLIRNSTEKFTLLVFVKVIGKNPFWI